MEVKLVLIPARDEELTIAKVIVNAERFCDGVVVCDDGSEDDTARIAEGLGVELILHERNEGKGQALKSLFLKAVEMGADEAVTIDADSQHDPREIPKLLEALKVADVVIGSRKGLSPVRGAGNRLLSSKGLDAQSGFRAYRGSVLPFLIPSEQGYGADAEILALAMGKGLRIAQVPVSNFDDVPNPHKSNIGVHFLVVFFSRFKLLAVERPGLFYGVPGLVALAASLYFGYNARQYLYTEGFGSVMLFILALFLLAAAAVIWTNMTMLRRAQR